jgi:hypothetical protein
LLQHARHPAAGKTGIHFQRQEDVNKWQKTRERFVRTRPLQAIVNATGLQGACTYRVHLID